MRRILLCLFALLCTFNCQSLAEDASGADAFAGCVSGPPMRAEPALRDFLRDRALRLKQDWQQKGSPDLPGVLATFDEKKQSWSVNSCNEKVKLADQETAIKLVETVLQDKPPSGTKQFAVVFVFNSYPDKASTPKEASKPEPADTVPRADTLPPRAVAAIADIDFGPYMALLQRKIMSNWSSSKTPEKAIKSVVEFALQENGAITGLKLDQTSGNANYDKAALSAIADSEPFLPLPKGSEAPIAIQFTFNYDPSSKAIDQIFDIELAQPEAVSVRSADLSALNSMFIHLRHF